ncbi:hypothetical protein SteCoe_9815 [Stentor coeruleus]|uniref:Uncharacterized protein n=1 Tax=Stentor coeruleus TaxID=5963 RepID=A0A1R2CH34_9CILI|nr:hypothetical protein SteCoe_9815 [Stentor coeruleus]
MGCAVVFRRIPSIHEQKKRPLIYLKHTKPDLRIHGLFCILEENSWLEQSINQYRKETRVITEEPNT